MKKVQTTYKLVDNNRWSALLTKNEESEGSYSIHDYGEPCSGLLKHWDTIPNHITFFEKIIKALQAYDKKQQ